MSDDGAPVLLRPGQSLEWRGRTVPADQHHRAVVSGDRGRVVDVMGPDPDGALQVVVTFNDDNTFVALERDIAVAP